MSRARNVRGGGCTSEVLGSGVGSCHLPLEKEILRLRDTTALFVTFRQNRCRRLKGAGVRAAYTGASGGVVVWARTAASSRQAADGQGWSMTWMMYWAASFGCVAEPLAFPSDTGMEDTTPDDSDTTHISEAQDADTDTDTDKDTDTDTDTDRHRQRHCANPGSQHVRTQWG